jgi:hypothetical protein
MCALATADRAENLTGVELVNHPNPNTAVHVIPYAVMRRHSRIAAAAVVSSHPPAARNVPAPLLPHPPGELVPNSVFSSVRASAIDPPDSRTSRSFLDWLGGAAGGYRTYDLSLTKGVLYH